MKTRGRWKKKEGMWVNVNGNVCIIFLWKIYTQDRFDLFHRIIMNSSVEAKAEVEVEAEADEEYVCCMLNVQYWM